MGSPLRHAWNTFNSFFTRLLFLVHSVISMYLLYNNGSLHKIHLVLIIPFIFLISESVFTLWFKNGEEWKYFWPSGFFYISCILPIIWIVELDLLHKRLAKRDENITTLSTTSATFHRHRTDGLYLHAVEVSESVVGKKICEIGVIIGILIGRWFMPKGSISRNQLSALLLGYVGNAADILDLFSAFDYPQLIYEKDVTIIVLLLYSWALCQFTLVTTIKDDRKSIKNIENNPYRNTRNGIPHIDRTSEANTADNNINSENCMNDVNTQDQLHPRSVCLNVESGNDRQLSPGQQSISQQLLSPQQLSPQHSKRNKSYHLHELFQIMVTLLMQDGPFLLLRLFMCIKYKIYDILLIFFLVKNAVVCILLIYRLFVLHCHIKEKIMARYLQHITVGRSNEAEIILIRDMTTGEDDVGNESSAPEENITLDISSSEENVTLDNSGSETFSRKNCIS